MDHSTKDALSTNKRYAELFGLRSMLYGCGGWTRLSCISEEILGLGLSLRGYPMGSRTHDCVLPDIMMAFRQGNSARAEEGQIMQTTRAGADQGSEWAFTMQIEDTRSRIDVVQEMWVEGMSESRRSTKSESPGAKQAHVILIGMARALSPCFGLRKHRSRIPGLQQRLPSVNMVSDFKRPRIHSPHRYLCSVPKARLHFHHNLSHEVLAP